MHVHEHSFYLQCIQNARSVQGTTTAQDKCCGCACVCVPKLHLVAIMQSGVWESGDGERRGVGGELWQTKILPSPHPFDVFPLVSNKPMSLRKRPEEKQDTSR